MPQRDIITFSIYLQGLFDRAVGKSDSEAVKEAMEVYE